MKRDIKETIQYLMQDPIKAKQLISASLLHFFLVFHYLTTGSEFTVKDFHRNLIQTLKSIVFTKQKNILVQMPPRAGKSEIINYFVCWTYTINPFCNNIITCYSDELVGKFSKKMKAIIDTELYQKVFNLKISNDTHSVGLWKLLNGGETRAVSINGSATGFGAGISGQEYGGALFIDDPQKPQEARSEIIRQKVIDTFNQTLKTRRNNLGETPIILTMQRVHKYDLAGYIEEQINTGNYDKDKWVNIKVPAIQEDGTSFWQEKYPIETLEEMRKSDIYTFNAQYMQNPTSESRNFFDTSMIEETTTKNIDDFDYTYITADTAYKDGQDNDYTVFTCFGVLDKKLYLVDMLRDKIQAKDIEGRAIPFIRKNTTYGFEGCFIEPKGHGIYLNQVLSDKNIVMPRERDVTEFFKDRRLDKVQRANAIMPFFTNNKLYLNDNIAKHLKNEIVDECINFPDGLHDDIVDTVIDGIKYFMDKEIINEYAW